jgi:ABC-type bacteriocin/lantibiotic exporter with double-glycine peptidase domain
MFSIGAMLYVGGNTIVSGKSNIVASELICFLVVFCSLNAPMRDLIKCSFGIRKAMASSLRYNKIATIEEDTFSAGVAFDSGVTHCIKYDGVHFGYGGSEFLHGVSLNIKAGQKIAIVGATGSGKTSLLSLLLKFFKPSKGRILIDGVDIDKINTKQVRDNISYVGQDCFLFNDTIYNNIALATGCTDLAEVVRAAQQACIHDYIMSLPEQYNTVIGDNGLSLSGGQRQCVCLARAFLKNAPVFVLDEATSALDKKLESRVMESIKKVCERKTLILITHKLPDNFNFDAVYSISNGVIKK